MVDEAGEHHEQGDLEVLGGRVLQSLHDPGPGTYRVSYRIGSADGHPVTGTITFTIAGDDSSARTDQAAESVRTPQTRFC